MSHYHKAPSQRQLKVGERVRHILAGVFMRADFHDPALRGKMITVSEVSVSPDLKHATAFVSELGQNSNQDLIDDLNRNSHEFSHSVAKEMTTKYTPKIKFEYDRSYAKVERINDILDRTDEIDT